MSHSLRLNMRFLFISEWAEDLNCREQKKRSVISKVNLPVDRKSPKRPKGFFLRGNTERETEWWIDVIKTKRRPNINWLQRRRSRKLVYFNPNLRKMNMRWSRGLEQEQSRILWPHWSSVFHCCLEWPKDWRRRDADDWRARSWVETEPSVLHAETASVGVSSTSSSSRKLLELFVFFSWFQSTQAEMIHVVTHLLQESDVRNTKCSLTT